jgi:hypothetical protein
MRRKVFTSSLKRISAFSLAGYALYQPLIVSPLHAGNGQCLHNIITIGVIIIIIIIIIILLHTSQWTQLIPCPEPSGVCNAIGNELKLLVSFCPIRGVVEAQIFRCAVSFLCQPLSFCLPVG